MILTSNPVLSEEDLKEVFSLFTSSTKYEREQVYDTHSGHYYMDEELSEEYSLNEEKREYALDAWRAVMYFLYRKGYSLCKDGKEIDLSFSEEEFIA
jgi:hypothetical protein